MSTEREESRPEGTSEEEPVGLCQRRKYSEFWPAPRRGKLQESMKTENKEEQANLGLPRK